MPRLLSSYAANKRVEDGLRRKQEQIRLDYMRTTHRYLDETEKLVDDLIQINVKTPNAFETSLPSSANNSSRLLVNPNSTAQAAITSLRGAHQQNVQTPSQPQLNGIPGDSLTAMLRNRSRTLLTNDGTGTDDGSSASRKEIPLPIVKVRGKDVFYQYENQKSNWRKVEPTYRTKVLLQRNDTVANALKQYALNVTQKQTLSPRNPEIIIHPENNRRQSMLSRRDSDMRRASMLSSRRGSRRSSRFSNFDDDFDDEEEFNRIPPIVEIKPQLSPGHTPRMLNGWTIMNWCLWNKQQSKPVWATKRYIERKKRELKRFQAARSAATKQQDLPPKPASANATTREARQKESEQPSLTMRAKSVPVNRVSMTIEEEEEEDDDENVSKSDEINERPLNTASLRPTTSILRLHREENVDLTKTDELRPKTTQSFRRVALDTYVDSHTTDGINNSNSIVLNSSRTSNSNHKLAINHDNYETKQRKSKFTGKSVKINDPNLIQQNKEIELDIFTQTPDNQALSETTSQISVANRSKTRIPKLAATPITVNAEEENYDNSRRKSSSVVFNSQKHKNMGQRSKTTVIFPEVHNTN